MSKATEIFEKMAGVRLDKVKGWFGAGNTMSKAAPGNTNRFIEHLDDAQDVTKTTSEMLGRTADEGKKSIMAGEVAKATLRHERRKKFPGNAKKSEEKYITDMQDIERAAIRETESKARNKVLNTMAGLGLVGGAGYYMATKDR